MQSETPTTSPDVIVVGGGITGCATAYHLAQRGAAVTVLERGQLNTEASGRNAGSLHGQLQNDGFLRLGERWAHESMSSLSLLIDSIAAWREAGPALGVDLEVTTNGGLLVAETDQQMRDIERKVAVERSHGLEMELLDRAGLRQKAPYVSETMVGAEFSPYEGKANPLVAAPAFAAAAERHGAQIRTSTEVLGLATDGRDFVVRTSHGDLAAHRVVLTAGADLPRLCAGFVGAMPICPEPVQVNATEPVAPLVPHLLYFAGARLTLKQAKAGSLLIGGGWPAARDAAGDPVISAASLRANLAVAQRVVPAVGHARLIRSWVGVGTGTPDQRPIIGELKAAPGLYVGMFPYMGLTAGPLLGQILADLVLQRPVDRSLDEFSPERF